MNLSFLNPAGFLALLAIPLILAIHFLRQRRRVIYISTFFLLEHTKQKTSSGSHIESLTNSIPLWLQLLAILLITWLLVEPRILKEDSLQQVAIVLDSSASMSAFKKKALKTLEQKLPPLKGSAKKLQISLYSQDKEQAKPLYSGEEFQKALLHLAEWQPLGGKQDPTNALQLARSRLPREGILIYLTDQIPESLPFGAQTLAIGEPLDNFGFTGLTITNGGREWQATIKNYSARTKQISWTIKHENEPLSKETNIQLTGNGLELIKGTFTDEQERFTLILNTEDAFPLDDELPIISPQKKGLLINNQLSPNHPKWQTALNKSLKQWQGQEGKLTLTSYDPLLPVSPEGHAIIAIEEPTPTSTYQSGLITSANHPYMENLNWQPLQTQTGISIPLHQRDQPLLWIGKHPAILLRKHGSHRQLLFNFDPKHSNIATLPSTAVLLHRFFKNLCENHLVGLEHTNIETGQEINISTTKEPEELLYKQTNLKGETSTKKLEPNSLIQAPPTPGFLEINQNGAPLLKSAVHFADTREADFQKCTSINEITAPSAKASLKKSSRRDTLWPLWVLLLGLALILAWYYENERKLPRPSPHG